MRGYFHLHPVARPEPDKILNRHTRRMGEHAILIVEPQPVGRVRKELDYFSFYFHRLFLIKDPSLTVGAP